MKKVAAMQVEINNKDSKIEKKPSKNIKCQQNATARA